MATMMQARVRPASTADYRSPSRPRSIGLVLSVAGLMLALVTLIVNLTVSTDSAATTLPWSFGLTTTAFGTIKVAIAVVLWGIVMKLLGSGRLNRDHTRQGVAPGARFRIRRLRQPVRCGNVRRFGS